MLKLIDVKNPVLPYVKLLTMGMGMDSSEEFYDWVLSPEYLTASRYRKAKKYLERHINEINRDVTVIRAFMNTDDPQEVRC